MDKEELEQMRDALAESIDWITYDRDCRVTTSTQWHEADMLLDRLIKARKLVYDRLEKM